MSLLPKRRSQSETRTTSKDYDNGTNNNAKNVLGKVRQNLQFPHMDKGIMGKRRTSAEMISEAKTFLSDVGGGSTNVLNNQPTSVVGGLRLINTKRPITPREPGRALYGKVAMAGRPPSSFSLRYLQNADSRGSTSSWANNLETSKEEDDNATEQWTTQKVVSQNQPAAADTTGNSFARRSQSSFEDMENNNILSGSNSNSNMALQTMSTNNKQLPRKLPALDVKPCPVKKENLKNFRQKLRAKTAHGEHSENNNDNSVTLTGENAENSRALTLLETRKILTRPNDLLAQSSTEKLIDMLKEHSGLKDCTEETVNHIAAILNELYNRVHKDADSFNKGFILGGLYGLVECTSPKILLSVARVVLALCVSGSNLTGACKLIFKVARNEQNDHLFHENNILELLIDGLGRASPLEDPEACIYGYGSIRFLTCSTSFERSELGALKDLNRSWTEHLDLPRKPNTAPNPGEYPQMKTSCEETQKKYVQKLSKQDALVLRLSRHGAVQLMILHLQMLNEAGSARKLEGPPLHSLYQLSAALRDLADVRTIVSSLEHLDISRPHFDNTSIHLELACPHLIKAAEVTIGEIEVQANIIRTLSVLSEDWDCCRAMEKFAPRIGMLLGPCITDDNVANAEKLLTLISRLGYILGNIMTNYDLARIQFFHNDVAMEFLINVLEKYSKEPLTLHNSLGDTVLDVLIKMIRVVANMSVDSEVGHGLGHVRMLGAMLLDVLKTTQQFQSTQLKQELQELCNATLGALHNLCYYQDQGHLTAPPLVQEAKGCLDTILPELSTELSAILLKSRNELTKSEAARVLGNLTRNEKARKYFSQSKGLLIIVQILSDPKTKQIHDLEECAIGVLVNLLSDPENRVPFLQSEGPEILLNLLNDALHEHEDWYMATVICQAYWNLFIDTHHLEDVCAEATLDGIIGLLAEYLDDEKLLSVDKMFSHHQMWEDFIMVSDYLLEHLQSHYRHESESESEIDYGNEDDEDDVYIDDM